RLGPTHHHDTLSHLLMSSQLLLDLPRLDAIPPDLDLLIRSPYILDLLLLIEPHQIPRPVQPPPLLWAFKGRYLVTRTRVGLSPPTWIGRIVAQRERGQWATRAGTSPRPYGWIGYCPYEWIGYKPFCRLLPSPPVPLRQSHATQIQLSYHSLRCEMPLLIHDISLYV